MASTRQRTVGGRGLGGELRTLREARKLSVRKVAAQLGWPASKLSKMETGQQGIKVEDVASLLVIYGVIGDERKRLLRMAERSDEPGWWEVAPGLSKEFRTLALLEAEVTAMVNFEPLLIPGLLQTPDYARALMKAGGLTGDAAEQRVAARMARQAMLTRDEPPSLHMIIDEMVLRRVLGGPRVMARQLRHLAEATEAPNVTLRVLPFALGGHTGLDGSFAIMDFARNRPVVHLEHKLAAGFLEEPHEVSFFRHQADTLNDVALSQAKSLDFVARVATEHDRE